jgi:two-component system, chemotaxis family, protein-glutamate methylesterase/glutaminase
MTEQQPTSFNKIKILIVDDSSIVRSLLKQFLAKDAALNVVAESVDGNDAIEKTERYKPDVVLLDVEMPNMDGITALPKILEVSPKTKVIMCSTLTERGAAISLKALSLGAVECLAKPSTNGGDGVLQLFEHLLIRTIKGLFPEIIRANSLKDQSVNKQKLEDETVRMLRGEVAPSQSTGAPAKSSTARLAQEDCKLHTDPMAYKGIPKILAIGCSTGGPQALFQVLKHMQGINVPIVITQHMPPKFTSMLAEHIQNQCHIHCMEGENGMRLEPNKIYIAPGGFHMVFKKQGENIQIVLDEGPPVNFCKPAVDPMFESLVKIYGQTILGVILTGMGQDGLEGSRKLVEQHGRLIAQDKETSTVWGMPGMVASAGLCHKILPLPEIGPWIKKQF